MTFRLGYVFFRSLLRCFTKLTAVAPNASDDGLVHAVRTVMSAFALRADDALIEQFLQRESELQSFVSGRPLQLILHSVQQWKLKRRVPSLATEQAPRRNLELALEAERRIRSGLEASLSCRITKPLRIASAAIRRLVRSSTIPTVGRGNL